VASTSGGINPSAPFPLTHCFDKTRPSLEKSLESVASTFGDLHPAASFPSHRCVGHDTPVLPVSSERERVEGTDRRGTFIFLVTLFVGARADASPEHAWLRILLVRRSCGVETGVESGAIGVCGGVSPWFLLLSTRRAQRRCFVGHDASQTLVRREKNLKIAHRTSKKTIP